VSAVQSGRKLRHGLQKDGARMSQRREGGDGGGFARRSFSVDDLRLCTSAAQDMSGSVQIRAAADSRRVMSVQFVGTVGGLRIKLLQLINGQVQEFELARLSYRNLAACWAWERNDMFVIAAVEDATSFRLFHEIYCWPQDISRNDWLAFFESKSVRTMTVQRCKMSAACVSADALFRPFHLSSRRNSYLCHHGRMLRLLVLLVLLALLDGIPCLLLVPCGAAPGRCCQSAHAAALKHCAAASRRRTPSCQ